MGYCDYLYKKENIIGYTGELDNNPTVYFMSESRDVNGNLKTQTVRGVAQILFLNGHITQAHREQSNIGRERVKESYSYSIMNVGPEMIHNFDEPGLRSQETLHQSEQPLQQDQHGRYVGGYPTPDGFTDIHISRTTFKSVGPADKAELDKLAKAITKFPYIKSMYAHSEAAV